VYPATHFLTISRGVFSKALDMGALGSAFWPLLAAVPFILGATLLMLRKQDR
jgi:ribosome-dependent ATPase